MGLRFRERKYGLMGDRFEIIYARNSSNQFTKEDTKLVKGIAILLMLAHHLWLFPDRLVSDLPLTSLTSAGLKIAADLGAFGKICVSIFMFAGGYGTYLLYEKKQLNWVEKIKKLYVSYWKVFFIFVPLGFLFFHGQSDYCQNTAICHVYDHFELPVFLANLAGVQSGYNGEWWFFGSYVIALATFPVILKMIKNNGIGVNLWIVCIYQILITFVFPRLGGGEGIPAFSGLNESWLYRTLFTQTAPWAACFWCGAAFAKDHVLETLRERLDAAGLCNPAAALAAVIGTFYLRTYVVSQELDFLYVPVLCIYGTYLLNRTCWLKKCVLGLGKQSTNMWLAHTFFLYYFYEMARLVLYVQNAYLVFVVFVAVSYVAACGVDGFYRILHVVWNRIRQSIPRSYIK